MELSILDVAFVVAVTCFFKTQFGWAEKHALLAALGVALVVGLAPQVAVVLPAIEPWIAAVLNVIKIFLAAAGSYDFAANLVDRARSG
jgi:hypothetical protein